MRTSATALPRLPLLAAVLAVSIFSGCGGARTVPPTRSAGPASADDALIAGPVRTSAVRGVQVSVHLPLRNQADLEALIERQGQEGSPDYRHFLTPAQFRQRYGPAPADLSTAAATLQSMGFRTEITSQTVLASAPQDAVERAFGTRVRSTLVHGRSALSFERTATLPASLARLGATVALSPFVRHLHARRATALARVPQNRFGPAGPYWFDDLKQAYTYPSYEVARGGGRTIGIVIDSDVLDSDLAMYFGHEDLAPPAVERRPVDGGPPAFDPNSDAAGEASLDVEQAAGSAPGAHVMLYGVPDLSDQSVYDGYAAAVEDNRADIVSSSFGICELYYTKPYNNGVDFTDVLRQFHDLFVQGNAQGISFVSSSGDNGAFDCLDPQGTRFVKGVENPADDPAVTGVGGTNLITQFVPGSRASGYVSENAFPDPYDPAQGALPNQIFGSGGGESVIFGKPFYQLLVTTGSAKRAVPDLAMHSGGCPVGAIAPCPDDRSSDIVATGGVFYLVVGTSAAAPEFAGLLAVTEGDLGSRLGNANYYIYLLARLLGPAAFHQNIPGSNGIYSTRRGYNMVVGNGTPRGNAFALRPLGPIAGIPKTPTNP